MTIFCVFGASSTYGAWDIEGSGWVSRLRGYLDKKNAQDLVYNLGVSGNTTTDLLNRFGLECKSRIAEAIQYKEPFVIIISIGDNDTYLVNKKPKVTKAKFESNINAIIKLAKNYTNKVFFLDMKPVDESKTDPVSWNESISYKNSLIEDYNSSLLRICKRNKVEVIKIHDKLKKMDYDKVLYDGLHQNSTGHKMIYQIVKEFLIKKDII